MSPQAKDKVDATLNRVEKYGLSLVLLIAILWWFAPKMDRLFDKHIQFMEQTEAVQKQQAETQAVGAAVLNRIDSKVDATHTMLRDLHQRQFGPAVGHAEPPRKPD